MTAALLDPETERWGEGISTSSPAQIMEEQKSAKRIRLARGRTDDAANTTMILTL